MIGSELDGPHGRVRRAFSIMIVTDDEVHARNSVLTSPDTGDTHGPVPSITFSLTKNTIKKKKQLIKLAADILLYSGAKTIIQSKWPPGMMIHIMSTMKMGFVVDQNCEAIQVNRLFIADNSGLGGTNPTLTTQALATRTAEKIQGMYF